MAGYAFNGVNTWNNASYFLDPGNISCPILIPAGNNFASDGSYPVYITALHPFWSGRGAARSASASLGSFATAGFTLGAGSSGTQQALGIGAPFRGGAQYQILALGANGATNFGRQSGVGGITVSLSSGANWASSSIGGYFDYGWAPAQPSTPVIVDNGGGSVTVSFSGSGDTGQFAITGWYLEYSLSPSFASGNTTIASSGTSTLTLTPGATYYFRAAGSNICTDYWGIYGGWSGVSAWTVQSGGKRYDAPTSAFVTAVAKRFDTTSSAWVSVNTVKRYDAATSTWVVAH